MMLDAREREELGRGMKVARILWAAMLSSLGVYLLVCHRVAAQLPGGRSPEVLSALRSALVAAAAAELIVIRHLRRVLLKTGPGAPRQAPPRTVPGAVSHPAAARYMVATVVSLALAESIGIYGVLLFFLGADFRTLYLFIAVSAAAMIHFRPKPGELEDLAAAMKADR